MSHSLAAGIRSIGITVGGCAVIVAITLPLDQKPRSSPEDATRAVNTNELLQEAHVADMQVAVFRVDALSGSMACSPQLDPIHLPRNAAVIPHR